MKWGYGEWGSKMNTVNVLNNEWRQMCRGGGETECWVRLYRELDVCSLMLSGRWDRERGLIQGAEVRWPVGETDHTVTCVTWFENEELAREFMVRKMNDMMSV